MKSSKRALFLPLVITVLAFMLLGFGSWIIQPHNAQADVNNDLVGFLPILFSNNQVPVPTPTPTPTTEPSPTPVLTPTPSPNGPERVVFDWKRSVTESQHGFPGVKGNQMLVNDDWTYPVNYAEGELHFRAIVRDMPTGQQMRLQFCIWQRDEETGNNNGLENCGPTTILDATSMPASTTWKVRIDEKGWYKKDDILLDWQRERFRYAAVIKTVGRCAVTDWTVPASGSCPAGEDGNQLIWGGEDPTAWYPMDLRFTVVSVAKEGTFSGWANYPE